jgi:hypothetical protein
VRRDERCQRDLQDSAAHHDHFHDYADRSRRLDDHGASRHTVTDPTTVAHVPTSLGPLRFDLPAEAVIDPRRRSPLPEFVTANQRWIAPGTVNLA